jgi:hypothetical protein
MPAFLLALLPKAAGLLTNPRAWAALGVVVLMVSLGVQTARLNHAKGDLKSSRAALVDPASHRRWQDLAEDRARDLQTCRANTNTLQSAIDRQNASVAALKAEGDRRTTQAAAAVRDAQRGRSDAEARASKLAALKPAGADACARMNDADRAVLETLR